MIQFGKRRLENNSSQVSLVAGNHTMVVEPNEKYVLIRAAGWVNLARRHVKSNTSIIGHPAS